MANMRSPGGGGTSLADLEAHNRTEEQNKKYEYNKRVASEMATRGYIRAGFYSLSDPNDDEKTLAQATNSSQARLTTADTTVGLLKDGVYRREGERFDVRLENGTATLVKADRSRWERIKDTFGTASYEMGTIEDNTRLQVSALVHQGGNDKGENMTAVTIGWEPHHNQRAGIDNPSGYITRENLEKTLNTLESMKVGVEFDASVEDYLNKKGHKMHEFTIKVNGVESKQEMSYREYFYLRKQQINEREFSKTAEFHESNDKRVNKEYKTHLDSQPKLPGDEEGKKTTVLGATRPTADELKTKIDANEVRLQKLETIRKELEGKSETLEKKLEGKNPEAEAVAKHLQATKPEQQALVAAIKKEITEIKDSNHILSAEVNSRLNPAPTTPAAAPMPAEEKKQYQDLATKLASQAEKANKVDVSKLELQIQKTEQVAQQKVAALQQQRQQQQQPRRNP